MYSYVPVCICIVRVHVHTYVYRKEDYCMDVCMYVCIDQAWISPFRMNERIGGG